MTEHYRQILETIRDWRVIDREQLTALLCGPHYSPDGLRTALGRLVADGYLASSLRLAHHPRAQIGLARKRIVYYLAEKGRSHFDFTHQQRESLTRRVKQLGYYPERFPHAVGVSWVHTLLEIGHRRKLWSLSWQQGLHTAIERPEPQPGERKRHVPDAVAVMETFKAFRRFIEYEHRNEGQKTVNHARFYWEEYHAGRLDGRVIWVVKGPEKLRAIRTAIREQIPQAGALFVFLSQEEVELTSPESLLVARFLTASDELAPIVPGRKAQQAVA